MGDSHERRRDELDREATRLRRLARSLLFDDHGAEDLVQDAWLAALRRSKDHGADDPRPLGAWLTGTIRRLALHARRDRARRGRREAAAARPEGHSGSAQSVERIETLRRLLDAVEALEEPYHTAIVLRFLDDLPPRVIARRQGLPVNTVRTHVRRGLAQLRRTLDARDDEGRAFLLALAPLAGPMPRGAGLALSSGSSIANWTGGLVMNTHLKLALFGALALALLLGGLRLLDPTEDEKGTEGSTAAVALLPAPGGELDDGLARDAPANEDSPRVSATAQAGAGDWVVRGYVSLAGRSPLPRAAVRATLHAGGSTTGEVLEETRLVADGEGAVQWALDDPERLVTLVMVPSVPGHDGSAETVTVPPGDEPPQDLQLLSYPLDTLLVGRVIDAEGQPIGDARVFTRTNDAGTDADGRYRLPTSSYSQSQRVTALAEGFAMDHVTVTPLGSGETRAEDIVLVAERRLRGRLVDESGAPVAGVEVSLWLGEAIHDRSGEDGSFVLDGLDPSADELWLRVDPDGFCGQGRLVESAELEAGELEWTLHRGTRVRGRVRDVAGAPVAGAWLSIAQYSPAAIPRVETWSNADGTFEFPGVQACERSLWAVRAGFASAKLPIVVEWDSPVDGIEVVLERGHSLAGRVTDERGEPLHGVLVYSDDVSRSHFVPRSRTDREGRFRMGGLPDRSVTLGFLQHGFSRHEEQHSTLDRDDLVVQLRRSGVLAGRVVDGRTGEAVDAFRIRFTDPRLEPGEERLFGYWAAWSRTGLPFVGTDGHWSTELHERLEVGAVIGIEATAAGYAPAVLDHVVVREDPEPVLLELFQGSRVFGLVVAGEPQFPVAGATVRAFRTRPPGPDEDVELMARTDELGRFVLDGVSSGLVSLVVDHPECVRMLDGPFEVPVAGAVERWLELDQGSRITGRLLDFEGNPVRDQQMHLDAIEVPGTARRDWEERTNAEGAFSFEGLMPGEYQVSWRREFGDEAAYALMRFVRLESDTDAQVEVRPTGRARVSGTLHHAGGVPETIHVHMHPISDIDPDDRGSGMRRTHGTVAVQGRFTLDHVEPGTYMLSVRNSRLAGGTQVEVPGEGEVEVPLELRPSRR